MALLARGAAALLLAALLLQLGAAAPPPALPGRPSGAALQHGVDGGLAAQGEWAAAGPTSRRALLKQPLPNFEIGVPGPPKKPLG